MPAGPLRVGLIGSGAIGGPVADLLRDGGVDGCRLAGVLDLSGAAPERVADIGALMAASDLIVEAAGHDALRSYGPAVVAAGVDLLVVSVGALVDEALLDRLQRGEGRLLVSTGAIGGLDLLRAAHLMAPLDEVALETTKRPEVLVRPWMSAEVAGRLRAGRQPETVFDGSAREGAARFPATANAAATLALATVGLDATRVTVVADPAVTGARHVLRAAGAAGSYEVAVRNAPSARNPATSAVTAYAVARSLADQRRTVLIGV